MSDTNTIVFDQKTIDELEEYNPSTDGELLTAASAQTAKFAIYLNSTDLKEIEKTKSINLKQMQELLTLPSQEEFIMSMEENDLEQNSTNYQVPMLISPKLLINTIKLSIRNDENLQQATQETIGLMSPEDKEKLDNFNIKNGNAIGSIRTITSKSNDIYVMGASSFSEGFQTQAIGNQAHSAGSNTIAAGDNSYAGGLNTIANGTNQTVIGKYNIASQLDEINNYAFIIGNGQDNLNRSNAMTIDWDGNIKIAGNIQSLETPIENNHLTTKEYVDNKIEHQINNALISSDLIDIIYPIGSFYFSANNINPSTFFGGTWKQIKKKFLFAADDEDENEKYHGAGTGGAEEVTLSANQSGLPNHTHSFVQPTVDGGTCTSGGMSTNSTHAHAAPSGKDKNNKTGNASFMMYNSFNASGGLAEYRVTPVSSGTAYIPGSSKSTIDYWGGMNNTASASVAHTHSIPNHTHTVSGGKVESKAAQDATLAHNNMPPFLSVYIWKRIA